MVFLRQIWQRARLVLFTLAGWLAVHGVAWAQPAKKEETPSLNSSTYVMAYILVIAGIGLGMLLVSRSSNRRERARPEQFGEAKASEKEEK
jgi:TRAP-type C4-dicarboxylate transport system permease small subunit